MMVFFGRGAFSAEQVSRIEREADCTPSDAKKRAKAASKAGIGFDEFMKSGLYQMPANELKSYLKKKSPRESAKFLSSRENGVTEYEVYIQMKRANDLFGIPYVKFAKMELLGARDARLKEVGKKLSRKKERHISKIAVAMHVSENKALEIVNRIQGKYGYTSASIYKNQLYKMSDEELKNFLRETQSERAELEEKILSKTGWTKEQLASHKRHCAVDYGIDLAVYYACHCFEMSDDDLSKLGTMRDSKTLSAIYNRGHSAVLADKSRFNEIYSDFVGRKSWVNRDTDFDEFKDFAKGLDEVFCKPLDLSTGTGTFKKKIKDEDLRSVYEWFIEQSTYLVEECIVQHQEMAKFYPGSLNTVRLFTILYEGKFEAFASFVRFGVGGVTDNYSSGGIACGVDPKTGIILTNGSNERDERFETHPLSGVKFKGFQIPHWDLVLERAEAALKLVDGVNYVGWDVAIRDDDVVIVEGNSIPDLGVQQALFTEEGEFIREVYKKYLDAGMYDDMQEKTRNVMRLVHCTERKARGRLKAAYQNGIDYEDFLGKQLYRLTNKQIDRYAQDSVVGDIVDKVASKNGIKEGEAFLALRHAEMKFGIPFERFYKENLLGLSDDQLRQIA